MRTTLTIDPDVLLLVQEAMSRTRRSFKDVVNGALRAALAPECADGASVAPFRVTPHVSRLVGSHDLRGFNKLADELEDRALLAAEPEDRS